MSNAIMKITRPVNVIPMQPLLLIRIFWSVMFIATDATASAKFQRSGMGSW